MAIDIAIFPEQKVAEGYNMKSTVVVFNIRKWTVPGQDIPLLGIDKSWGAVRSVRKERNKRRKVVRGMARMMGGDRPDPASWGIEDNGDYNDNSRQMRTGEERVREEGGQQSKESEEELEQLERIVRRRVVRRVRKRQQRKRNKNSVMSDEETEQIQQLGRRRVRRRQGTKV